MGKYKTVKYRLVKRLGAIVSIIRINIIEFLRVIILWGTYTAMLPSAIRQSCQATSPVAGSNFKLGKLLMLEKATTEITAALTYSSLSNTSTQQSNFERN